MSKALNFNKPKQRSRIRLWAGKRFFTAKRYLQWLTRSRFYAKKKDKPALPFKIFEHQSLLLRNLKDVDMWLQHSKVTNLRLAISKLDGILIQPGEIFSFWYLVGMPSKLKGYKPGLVLENGKISKGTGGGLCQLGNLIYWMALHSGLTVTERWRHGFDVFPDQNRQLPFGSGATLSYNYIDLQLKNETDQTFQLKLWLSETHLHGSIHSEKEEMVVYKVYESHHLMDRAWWGGFIRHNQIRRKILDKRSEKLISDEPVTENHALMMYDPFLPEKTKSD